MLVSLACQWLVHWMWLSADAESQLGADVVDLLVVGVVRICVRDVSGIVRWLVEELK